MFRLGFYSSCAILSSYAVKSRKKKQRSSLLPLCSGTQNTLAKIKTAELTCRLVDVLSHFLCCRASLEAVSVSSPVQT